MKRAYDASKFERFCWKKFLSLVYRWHIGVFPLCKPFIGKDVMSNKLCKWHLTEAWKSNQKTADFTRVEKDTSALCTKMSNKILALKIGMYLYIQRFNDRFYHPLWPPQVVSYTRKLLKNDTSQYAKQIIMYLEMNYRSLSKISRAYFKLTRFLDVLIFEYFRVMLI